MRDGLRNMLRNMLFAIVCMAMPASISFANSLQASSLRANFLQDKARGWHWYEEKETRKEKPDQSNREDPLSPTEVIENFKAEINERLHAALVEPTEANLMAYMQIQKQVMAQSQKFTDAWRRVLLNHPFLDETLAFPVMQGARHIYLDEERRRREEKIRELAQHYGLVFFFRQNCLYCHRFAPVVKRFADKYGWSVLAVSMDGGQLPEFPRAQCDNGAAANMGVQIVPSLLAVHPKTKQASPLAYGMVSESEIEQRIEALTLDDDGGEQ